MYAFPSRGQELSGSPGRLTSFAPARRAPRAAERPAGPPPTKWQPLTAAQTLRPDGFPIDEEYVDEHSVLIGTMTVMVVGCQYYASD